MSQPNKKPSLEQVLKLASQLTPEEQDQLQKSLGELQELRKALAVGVDQLERGEGVPGDKVFERLYERHKQLVNEQKDK